MRFDKEKLAALAAMPDDKLWAEVVKIRYPSVSCALQE